jgi:hypothetical protein
MEEYRVLNINDIEKVTEKQVLKPELKADQAIENMDAMNDELDSDDIDSEIDSPEDMATDLAADFSGDLEVEALAGEPELHAKLAGQESLENIDSYNDFDVDSIDNILDLKPDQFPRFTLAKNKARFLRMVSDYRSKQEWLDVAPLSGVAKLFKTQTKELVGIRSKKLDYEMEIEMGTLTPVQISHRRDELKMCKVQEKMAVSLISKMQVKIRSGRR